MQDDSFSRPVVFFAKQPDGSVRPLELATVRDGFQALNRGLEGFCLNDPEWHLAFHHLSRAMLEPTRTASRPPGRPSTSSPASPA
ncbi:MAG TPA: hypothetical protein VF744_13955 [Beijerinckiaceae bacterium]|jgi:hypothetical protein